MFLQRFSPAAIAVACLAVCASAKADTDSAFRFSGFGTVGITHTDEGTAEFVIPGQRYSQGATSSGVSFNPDTKLGLQGVYTLNSTFSGTLQVLSKYNGKGYYDPSVEWAFVKAKFLNDWSVRAGRVSTPIFMISDYREVNFANLWVRPPIEVYGQVVFSHTDGADLSYQHNFDLATLSASVFAGKAKAVYNTADVELKNQLGFNVSAETDEGLTLRVGYSQGDLTVASPRFQQLAASLTGVATTSALAGGLVGAPGTTAYRAGALQLADTLSQAGDRASFLGFGASWDHGNWLISSEFTKRKVGDALADTTGWYASVGYRIGKFTPYTYASQLKVDKGRMNNPNSLLPSGYLANASLKYLTAATTYVVGTQEIGQKTIAIGTKWDAWRNMAVKVQLESIKPEGNAVGLFNSASPTLTNPVSPSLKDKTINVLSLTVDFVF